MGELTAAERAAFDRARARGRDDFRSLPRADKVIAEEDSIGALDWRDFCDERPAPGWLTGFTEALQQWVEAGYDDR